VAVETLYVSYKDKAEFFLVYIREAHPDIRQGGKEIGKAESIEEKAILASKCVSELKLTMPALIDDMEGTVERAYRGWPDRMCIVDLDGKVKYYSERGPFGFKPDEGEKALRELLGKGGRINGPVIAGAEKQKLAVKEAAKDKWSRVVRELRGCVTVNSHKLTIGKTFIANIQIQNLGYDRLYLYYIDVYEAQPLDIMGKNGDSVKGVIKVMYKLPPEDGRSFHPIEPGGIFERQLEGRLVLKVPKGLGAESQQDKKQLVLDFGDIEYPLGTGGEFEVAFVLKVDEQATALGEKLGKKPVWEGDLRLEIGAMEFRADKRQ
jgi:hypothetical protein